jgi:D-alanine-D-alanine ligase
MKTDAKILICYNSPVSIFTIYNGKPASAGSSPNDLSETGFSKEISKIKRNLAENFTEIKTFAVDGNTERLITVINSYSPDIIFNFVESVEGVSTYEYCVAGLYQLLEYNFTGNFAHCLGNCLDKGRAKDILRAHGINTPAFTTLSYPKKIAEKEFKLHYPVILKLLKEDASIGISEFSVVDNYKNLIKQIAFLQRTYKQDILIEEFIDGRELNVAILGNSALPISEIEFKTLPSGLPKIVTYDGKWMEDSVYYENTKPVCPAILTEKIKKRVEKTALLAFEAMGCRDYARVDIRLNSIGVPFVIEVNPNPDISTDSGFARASAAAGKSYSDLLYCIANFALSRKRNDSQNKAS